jgi:hypothetical protein
MKNTTVPNQSEAKECLRIIIIEEEAEKKRFDQLMGEYHYLGETRPIGDFLRQVATINGEWVALLAWGAASYALSERDKYIGWNPAQRAERLKLIVQNRRFLMLGEKGAQPNLASRILSRSLMALPEQWQSRFGYTPLLAETFSDIEAYQGTCYKATGWMPLGMTQGYSRHRADFYVPNDRPKKLWVKKLRVNALELLCQVELSPEFQSGGCGSAHGIMPLKQGQVEDLRDVLRGLKDPRRFNRTFRLSMILTIVVMALMSGAKDISQIYRFGCRLTQAQRKQLGLPCKIGGKFRRVPGYKVYYNLLNRIKPKELTDVLNPWLQKHQGSLPAELAMDGKMIGSIIGVLSLADHETGVPHAMACMNAKEGDDAQCELKTAQTLINEQEDLSQKVITADALHCQTVTAQSIAVKGGDYIFQVKGNQKTILELVEAQLANTPFLP